MKQQKNPIINLVNSERIERLLNIGHWHLDLQTQKLYWSDEIFKIYGLSPEVYEPDVTTAIEAFHPDDQKEVTDLFEQLINDGQNHLNIARLIHGDGTIRKILGTSDIRKDKDGKIIAVEGAIQDITDYLEEQERYERAALASGTAIWDWDIINDRIHWLGHSYRSLGFINENDIPNSGEQFFKGLIHEDYELFFKDMIDTHLKEKTELEADIKIHKADGSTIWVMVRGQAQWNIQEQAVRLSGSFTDINRLKQTKEKLLRSNTDLEQFASVAAHDLQSPLRTIASFLKLVKDNEATTLGGESKDYIQICIESAENMSALINDMLEYARLESEGLQTEEIDLTKIIQHAILPLKQLITETHAQIHFDDMPTIICDHHKMQRVLTNLIENALKYRKRNVPPIITIRAEKIDHNLFISVEDNGIGMDNRALNQIFMMFSRLHGKEDGYDGTGIGLSICQKIIALHSGNIWAESRAGIGSVFHIKIPC